MFIHHQSLSCIILPPLNRPFVFTGWLKLSNILSLAAAQKEDLVVSHVAFVLASRLLWCAEGIRGAEINVEVGEFMGKGMEFQGISPGNMGIET